MPLLIADLRIFRVLVVLAITQLIGWGTVSLPAVIGRQLAADLGMDIAAVFAGTSVFYIAMGIASPWLAAPFTRHGARRVMMAGTLVAVPGFALLAAAQGPLVYFAGWVCLGVAGSATLTTAGLIVLNEVAGRNAKSAIGALMLVTGLSSSVFWPTTAFLTGLLGWRGTCLVYAAIMPLVCLPLFAFGLPRRKAADATPVHGIAASAPPPAPSRSTFYLLLTTLGLYVFVTFGMGALLIELFKAEGLSATEAISFGSMLGVIQVAARAIDFLGGGRWDGITTAFVAGLALPISMLLLMSIGGATWTVALFMLLYGMGSGALAVARATMPLIFYDKAEFTRAMSRMALPLNILSAVSAPILVALLTRFGSNALLGLALFCSCAALAILVLLGRRRPRAVAAA
ncbi:MFS transporter [Bradyrhizobium sp. STM 3557]|uniref:MFS transporter n=1 Tax=Bradyrhizobium sp. STM 3557 TaxID=578920 RepID=UPI0038902DF3